MDLSVALKDPTDRLRYTLESIDHWLKVSPNIRLVICDGSGYDFSKIIMQNYPRQVAENLIECLNFTNDAALVATFGKGYGEGEIIKFALKNSKLLKNESVFCKCTAKLWVENFLDCLDLFNGKFLCQAYFSQVFSFKKTKLEHIDTRFYIVTKETYKMYFENLHTRVGGTFKQSIEDVFKESIENNNLNGVLFKKFPVICGVGGASGKYYRTHFIRRNKDRLRLIFVQLDKQFKNFFN